MKHPFAYRLLMATTWGMVLVAVAVCGIGVRLTATQHRHMQEILLQAERRGAESQLRQLLAFLTTVEEKALNGLIDAGPDGGSLSSVIDDHPFLRAPFFILTDGSVSAPFLLKPPVTSALAESDLPPAEVEDALKLCLSEAPVEEKLQALGSLYDSRTLATGWRLRALMNMATLHSNGGRAREAAGIYRTVLEEFSDFLGENRLPSFLHVSMAYAETLATLSETENASAVLQGALERLREGKLASTLDAEEFFFFKCVGLFSKLQLALPAGFASSRRDFDARRLVMTDMENFRHWLRDRIDLVRENPAYRVPQHLFTPFRDRLIPITWTQVEEGFGMLAVGFQIDLEGLRSLLQAQLAPNVGGEKLAVIFTEAGMSEDQEHLAAFPGPLSFFSLGLEREEWNEMLARERRPFVYAGALIVFLGAILLCSLFFIFRGVKREYAVSRMKTEIVANVSHELKTPLALIRLCGETLLLDRIRDNSQRSKYLQVITRESARLGQLLTNVLNFSSIEAGKKTYHLRPCDLSDIVRETLGSYELQLEEKGFKCVEDIPTALPVVRADDDAVAQALINLLQNAVRYSTEFKRLEVSARAVDGEVRISVRDFGVGISREDQKKVWEDYFRTGEARALRTHGSGLGLALVQHIMRGHGGRVELVSDPGEGSTFTLVFPVLREPSPEANERKFG